MPVTLNDISKRCGLSITTVSHVLGNGPHAARYSAATRQRVQRVADELDYRPDFFASQVRRGNRKTIMLCVGSLDDGYASAIAAAFERTVVRRGYSTFVSAWSSQEDVGLYRGALGNNGIQALAVVGYSSAAWLPDRRLAELAGGGASIVCIGRPVSSDKVSQVLYDNRAGIGKAVDSLLSSGARSFWLLGRAPGAALKHDIVSMRVDMAAEALSDASTEVSTRLLVRDNTSPGVGYAATREALATAPPPDAVICTADRLAWGCVRALVEAGLRVGEDVAVTGFNDEELSAYTTPPLATVRIPTALMGKIAADLLIDTYEETAEPGAKIDVDTDFMARESGRFLPASRPAKTEKTP